MTDIIRWFGDRERRCGREAAKNSLEGGNGGDCIPSNCPRWSRQNAGTFPDPKARP